MDACRHILHASSPLANLFDNEQTLAGYLSSIACLGWQDWLCISGKQQRLMSGFGQRWTSITFYTVRSTS